MEQTQTQRTIKSRKELTKEAISLALDGQWEDAVQINQAILGQVPADVETMNRLGKALSELGQYERAKEVLGEVIRLSPYNSIAKKNLARIVQLESAPAPSKQARKGRGTPKLFIEESGKSGTTVLHKTATGRIAASVAPGEPVNLAVENNVVNVYVGDSEYLGRIEPKLGRRLIRLMEGGNKYEAAIIGNNERGISAIIRESYSHPSLHNVCSFPSKGKEEHRVYLGDSLVGYVDDGDLGDDEEETGIVREDRDEPEWEE